MASDMEIDDSLYSRQRYVYGDNAMKQIAQSSVLLYGLGGLGVEIAKNIVLAGIKRLTIQDGTTCCVADLGTQFFINEGDVQARKNRAEACAERLAELNPYVEISTLTEPLTMASDLAYLQHFQCVILTECPQQIQLKINQFCRLCNPQIKFISADVYGVFGSIFCDFGDHFEVWDTSGEEPRETFIASITKANPGVVTCIENQLHGLETGDVVCFKEIKGMTPLNSLQCQVKVLSPSSFSICDTSTSDFPPYESGGIIRQVKVPKTVSFKSLQEQLSSPDLMVPDLNKFSVPINIHLAFRALNAFLSETGTLPAPWCQKSADMVIALAEAIRNPMAEKVDSMVVQCLSFTAQGRFAPMCAVIGGFVAQEGLKAVTGKFLPLNQWLYLDAMEVIPDMTTASPDHFIPRDDRLDHLRICVGEEICQKLADTRLFMVGCGAIGCEMLKNYALLGLGSGRSGQITITDNDLIEKSNLNRQFLFRSHHIRKPKSTCAAQAVLEINPCLHIEAHQYKVCPQTESTLYTDSFFERQDIMVNALDNVEARRYMDSRCVTTQRPLLESGTMGTKGHVQVIVPHLTESYTSQQDPVDEDFPYCTIKSFPASIEHCIQWARDKFEQLFVIQPNLFNKFFSCHTDLTSVAERLRSGEMVEGAIRVSKMAATRPRIWEDCVVLARIWFEKYFNLKAHQLLHAFPLDTKLQDGTPFWQSPKRPPAPLEFDVGDPLHISFITSAARLLSDIYNLPRLPEDMLPETYITILRRVQVPKFHPSNKRIETDEGKTKEDEATDVSEDEVVEAGRRFTYLCSKVDKEAVLKRMVPMEFEKDDDLNDHINFIAACSNLRAQMYSIEQVDRLKIKRIAGRIVPAIATTTAAVSGLVTIELLKVLQKMPLEAYRNAFLNLALPLLLLSEPGPCHRAVLREGLTVSMWDKWVIHGKKDTTLQQFLDSCKEQYGFNTSSVVHGVKIVYLPMMPLHRKRLPMTMLKLVKPESGVQYVDLIVGFDDQGKVVEGPPVRYFFGH
ncbi:ubiquitin-like modifier-activating enzyme 6 [Pomacea canaliculata]|uniref:ubiquitin-like modifier-activating enzyme 6 n=1 Tax=Pomacea canaliculata TaxID=400727 RepID=UPI000D7364B9|nr:ubiquitin-like modifier-activating enzyme 6 [Pomacea canaliculata]XP_025078408.1 ubiquitin-like modifier-activating enzyme 6 [Pomacea canaliculata]XP_025078410.1 ubiquitin-like modifier-activating enzyme 6 [Pomacea canaliculata]